MTTTSLLTIVGFWVMQVLSQLFFQWGSAGGSRWLWGFLGGNLFGLFSVFLLMSAYKFMNPNIAFGVCTGGPSSRDNWRWLLSAGPGFQTCNGAGSG